MNQPVTPALHGCIDYLFAASLMTFPRLLGVNGRARRTYAGFGAAFLTVNAFTDTPAGLIRKIAFRTHGSIDAAFLATSTLLTATGPVRRDRAALRFHLGFLALGALHFMLTDYRR